MTNAAATPCAARAAHSDGPSQASPQASDAIASLLTVRGIEVRTSARAYEDAAGALVVEPGHERLSVGGVVATLRY